MFGQTETAVDNNENISVESAADLRTVNLKKQAIELFAAYDQGNVDKFVALSQPDIYKITGRENFFEQARDAMTLRLEYEQALPSVVEPPGKIVEFDNRLFCVFPYKLRSMRGINKDKFEWLGSMVGILDNNARSWKFAKGVAFNEAFPNVAEMLVIPNPVEKRFVNDIEQ